VRRISWSSITELVPLPGFDLWCIGIDVTDRWQAMRAMTDREALLARLIEHIPEAVFLKDGDSRWQIANHTALRAMGLEQANWYNKSDQEMAAEFPSMSKFFMACSDSDETAWRLGKPHHCDEVIVAANGDAKYFSVDKVPTLDENGHRKEMIVVARDTTQERQTAARLTASEAQYRLLADHSHDMICLHEVDGRFRFLSPSVRLLLGYDMCTLVGTDPFVLIHPKDVERIRTENYQALLKGQAQSEVEFRMLRQSGDYLWVEVTAQAVLDDQGQMASFVTVTRDVQRRKQTELALADTSAKLRAALSLNRIALFDLHVPSGVASVSPEYAELLGYHPQTFVTSHKHWLERIHPDDQSKALQPVQQWLTRWHEADQPGPFQTIQHKLGNDQVYTGEYRQRTASGEYRWFKTSVSVFEQDENGQAVRLVGTHIDINTEKKASERIELAARVFEQSREGIVLTDLDGQIIYINAAFTNITGYALSEVVQRNPRLLASGVHDARYYRTIWESLKNTGRWQGEIWNRRKSGEIFPEWLEISALNDTAGEPTHYLGMFSDLSERKAIEEQIRVLTEVDPVTSLPNRHLLQDRCLQAFLQANRGGQRVALMLIDLDRFSWVNESLGHASGDLLLREVSRRLSELLRPGDTLGRLGGDEFALLLTGNIDEPAVIECAQRLFGVCQRSAVINGETISFSFSIGIALAPDAGEDFASLMRHADSALMQAKNAGRNTWRLADVNLNNQVLERLRVESGLRRAIEQHEFVLHYQPVINLRNGSLVGAEALVRWQTPDRGLLPPGDFISVAEDTGQIEQIGAWVLAEACCQIQRWNTDRVGLPPLRIAVNVAPRQLHRDLLEAQVQQALQVSGLPPELLELELTESALIKDAEHVIATLARIKKLGVRMAIDDFGTGYSSFAYLRRFQIDTLKVDQSFVRDLLTDPDDAAIVKAIIQMARSLGLSTLAEGVESAEVGSGLRLIECDFAQGYHFSRPLAAAAFSRFEAMHSEPAALSRTE
jgi:diguanylate cyclase (GGDEF)-like protein/PAS domain S-box-containing protein